MGRPLGVEIGFGKDAEASEKANRALLKALPVGLPFLLAALLADFSLFRRVHHSGYDAPFRCRDRAHPAAHRR